MDNIIGITTEEYENLKDTIKALSNRCYVHTKGCICEWCTIEGCTRRSKEFKYKEKKDE